MFEFATVAFAPLRVVLANLGTALTCGLALALLYRRTYRGSSYLVTFDRSLVTLTLITAVVIMVVGDNLARAFGLVGAMSIVRFRTALKDPQDLVFIFFSLAVGLASGVGLHALALSGTLVVGLVILILVRTGFGVLERREFVLQLSMVGDEPRDPVTAYGALLDGYTRTHRLLGARATTADTLDLTFYITLADHARAAELTRALAALPSVGSVNLFYDEPSA